LEKLVMTVHFYIHIEGKKRGERGGDICNVIAQLMKAGLSSRPESA
jgi:hypothetical protein